MTITWSNWVEDFRKGKTRVAYISITGLAAMLFLMVYFKTPFPYYIFAAVSFGMFIAVLVDTTAHLFVSGYTLGLSTYTQRELLLKFIDGRDHVIYGTIFGMLSAAVLYMINFYYSFVFFFYVLILIELVSARYYH